MKRIAVALQCIVALLCVVTALRYMFHGEYMPYHAAVAEMPWSSVPAGLQLVMLGMIRVVAAGFLGCGIAFAALALPVSKGQAWASWATLAVGAAVWLPTLSVSLMFVKAQPAAQPPLVPTVAMILTIVAASVAGAVSARSRGEA